MCKNCPRNLQRFKVHSKCATYRDIVLQMCANVTHIDYGYDYDSYNYEDYKPNKINVNSV